VHYLGEFFDIHCGGEDHIMVHHPNEIAQTQAVYKTRLANFWMHGYFLQINKSRMGKSEGNFIPLQKLIDKGYDPLVWRFYCLGAHYQTKLQFSWNALNAVTNRLNSLRRVAYEWGEQGMVDNGYLDQFTTQINDDLNVPRAMAVVQRLVKSKLPPSTKKATLLRFDDMLGLDFASWEPNLDTIPDEVLALVERRQQARLEKRWQDADMLREQIRAEGYEVEDTPQGSLIRAQENRIIDA